MTTKLDLYNLALGHLGPVRLASAVENRPDRFEIDAVYDQTLAVMLERGIWFFALRSSLVEPDTDVEPRFGLPYTYSFPADYVRLRMITTDESQAHEDTTYKREGRYFFSQHSELYLTYVSNDTNYGLNLGAFPELYAEAVAAELAYKSGLPITKDRGTKNDLLVIKKRALIEARRVDAVDERVKAKPGSSWVANRRGASAGAQRREST